MSDWTKQTEQLVNTWSDTQRSMWDNWLGAMEQMSAGNNLKAFEDERKKVVDTWESSVHKGLEAQSQWAKMWADSLASNKSTPKPMLEWAKQMQDMMKSWTDQQENLSKVWFEMMKKMDASDMTEMWESQGTQMMKTWQEAVDKSLEAQKSMTDMWSQTATKTAKKS